MKDRRKDHSPRSMAQDRMTGAPQGGIAISCRDLGKRYGASWALRNVSVDILPGQYVGLLGPNGSGKTTLLRVLLGYLWPTEGQAEIFGIRPSNPKGRRILGYASETAAPYPDMRVLAYVTYMARLSGLSRQDARKSARRILGCCGLDGAGGRIIGRLSKGYQQRVSLAQALVHQPALLLLDEPMSGLDPVQMRDLGSILQELSPRPTVLLSSHVLAETVPWCDRLIVLEKGLVIADDSVDQVRQGLMRAGSAKRVKLRVRARPGEFKRLIDRRCVTAEYESAGDGLESATITLKEPGAEVAALVAAIVAAGMDVLEVKHLDLSLEEALIRRLQKP